MADLRCTIISDFQDEEIAYLDYLDFKKADGSILTLDSWDSFCDRAFIGDATHWLFRTGSAFMFEDDREDEISLDDVDFSTLRPFISVTLIWITWLTLTRNPIITLSHLNIKKVMIGSL